MSLRKANWPAIFPNSEFFAKSCHTVQLDAESIRAVLPPCNGLCDALLKSHANFKNTAPIYFCRYPYASCVIGPWSKSDYFSNLLSPCGGAATRCDGCLALRDHTKNHRPLIFVISGVVEEYLEFQQVRKQGREADIIHERVIPLRLAYPGDCIGAYETLNAFYFEDYGKRGNKIFGGPARRVAAGARSVIMNASMSDIARSLKSRAGSGLSSHYYRVNDLTINELADKLDENHLKFLSMLAKGAGASWSCDLLVIPFSTLQKLIWDGRRVRPNAQDLLLQIHRLGWIQSRHSRSAHVRQAAVADRLAQKGSNLYQEQTVQHLLHVARGEFPAFAPFTNQNQAGPFTEVLEFINSSALVNSFSCFPSILQPTHLGTGKGQSSAVYYSFAQPTLLAPLRRQHSGPDLMQELKIRLSDVKRQGRTSVKDLNWHFYISRGLPKPNRHFDIFSDSADAETDFRDQQTLSRELDRLRQLPFFGPERDGFLSKFIRLSLQSDSRD